MTIYRSLLMIFLLAFICVGCGDADPGEEVDKEGGDYICDLRSGTCSDGDPESLILDVKTVTVAGKIKITQNGQNPTYAYDDNDECVFAHFSDVARSYEFSIGAPCNNQSAPFEFSGEIFPGTYRVTVSGKWDALPTERFVVIDRLRIE